MPNGVSDFTVLGGVVGVGIGPGCVRESAGAALGIENQPPSIVVVAVEVKAATGILTPGGPSGGPLMMHWSSFGITLVAQGCSVSQDRRFVLLNIA